MKAMLCIRRTKLTQNSWVNVYLFGVSQITLWQSFTLFTEWSTMGSNK